MNKCHNGIYSELQKESMHNLGILAKKINGVAARIYKALSPSTAVTYKIAIRD